jgi:alanine-glyoxylate transaminase/serine-glyoxylate transaminase/serine-pyruvate transaminase
VTRPPTGWYFLQLPGPSNVPERIREAIARPTIDHRGPDIPALTGEIFDGLRWLFRTKETVVMYPSSGTGAWEAALVNTLSPGDRVLMFETGQFGTEWARLAGRLGLDVTLIPGDWRHGAEPEVVEELLAADVDHAYRAVAVLHNETSTGVVSRIPEIRQAIDRARHPALFFVDTISSLASLDYRHDEWGVDVTVGGSQKGIMLPPGLSFNAISAKAREAHKAAKLPRSYWDWERMIAQNEEGYFPYTPATNMLFGLREALAMLREEGLENVFCRHTRYGEASRAAAAAWGLELQCAHPREHSNVLTAVRLPDGYDAEALRAFVVRRFNLALGSGLGRVKGKLFRIGHLGDMNDLMLLATLAGVESGMALSGIPIKRGGVEAAMLSLEETGQPAVSTS